MCARPSGSSVALLLLLALFSVLVICKAEGQEQESWIASSVSIEASLTALDEISVKLDEIANLSETELNLLKTQLLKVQEDLKIALQALADSEVSRLKYEASLKQSEHMLKRLEQQLLYWKLSTITLTLLFLIVLIF